MMPWGLQEFSSMILIIESKSGNDYIIRTYNTGVVTFGITVQ